MEPVPFPNPFLPKAPLPGFGAVPPAPTEKHEIMVERLDSDYDLLSHLYRVFRPDRSKEFYEPNEVMKIAFGLYHAFNETYSAMGFSWCTGWTPFSKPKGFRKPCRNALCPSCWYVGQLKCLAAIRALGPTYKYLYIKETGDLPIAGPVHPRVLQHFQGRSTKMDMIAMTYVFEQDESNRGSAETSSRIGRGAHPNDSSLLASNQVVVRLLGVFGSNEELKQRGRSYEQRTEWGVDGEHVGYQYLRDTSIYTLRTREFLCACDQFLADDTLHAILMYLERLGHPSTVNDHSSYRDAITWADALTRRYYTAHYNSADLKTAQEIQEELERQESE